MDAEILITVRPVECRVAYLERGELTELKIERKTSPTLVGSIHLGEVIRVLPGMQAAFVNIGLEKAAFLYVGDVRSDVHSIEPIFGREDVDNSEDSDIIIENLDSEESDARPKIQELLSEGQLILVQVSKDPIGTKGARLTTHISLPGRNIVYMPTVQHIGVSRRIESEEERDRLKKMVENLSPKGGVIIRTAGEGLTEEDIKSDLDYLERMWDEIKAKYDAKKDSGLIHAELGVELRALRDLLNPRVTQVLIDDNETFETSRDFVSRFMPKYKNIIKHYQGDAPLFDAYELDLEISRALERKVWLKSGGYIVMDEAEALTVIDVNTGRFVGKKDLEDTILKTNLEAVKEIAHQLRIRNCGGIIIVDFIDMEKEQHREKVLNLLREETKNDPAKTTIVSMTSLGIVEMTRKRMRPSLSKILCKPCPYCEGQGMVKQKSTIAQQIYQEVERERFSPQIRKTTFVKCHNEIANFIYSEENEMIEFLETRLGHSLAFKIEPDFHLEQFEVYTV